jgi:hypothetical protein
MSATTFGQTSERLVRGRAFSGSRGDCVHARARNAGGWQVTTTPEGSRVRHHANAGRPRWMDRTLLRAGGDPHVSKWRGALAGARLAHAPTDPLDVGPLARRPDGGRARPRRRTDRLRGGPYHLAPHAGGRAQPKECRHALGP